MPYLNGHTRDSNPAVFSGLESLRELLEQPPAPAQPELPFDPPLGPPAPPKKRRSRERGRLVRELMAATGRSAPFCRQLLRIAESGNVWAVAGVALHLFSVNKASSLI